MKESLFILDWDNTLFSTDYLKRAGFRFEYFFDQTAGTSKDDHLIDDYLIQDIGALEEASKLLTGLRSFCAFWPDSPPWDTSSSSPMRRSPGCRSVSSTFIPAFKPRCPNSGSRSSQLATFMPAACHVTS